MSTHDEIEELADLAAAGAWEPDAHATSCASCASTVAAAREFRAWASGAITPDAPPADLEDRVIARFRSTNTAAVRRLMLLPGQRFLKWAAAAAAVAGIVVLGGSFEPSADAGLNAMASAQADLRPDDLAGEKAVDFLSDGISLGEERKLRSVWNAAGDGRGGQNGDAVTYFDNSWGFTGRQSSMEGLSRGRGETGGGFPLNLGFTADGDKVHYARDLARFKENSEDTGVAIVGTRREARQTGLGDDAQVAVRQKEVESAQLAKLGVLVDKAEKLADNDAQAATAAVKLDPLSEKAGVAGKLKGEFETLAAGEPQVATLAAAYEPLPLQAAQKLVRNGKLALEVLSYEETQGKLTGLVTEEKGYVAGTSVERLQNGKARATVELRVPSERFDVLLAKVKALGTVKTQSVNVEDMTKAYADLQTRLEAKLAFADRLRKLLAEEKGKVDELLQVEKTLGETLEEIDKMKGELRFYDNRVALSTLTLEIAEKDLGQPFEYVQTLQSRIGLVTSDVDKAYADAQKAVLDAGGQVVDSKMTRQNDGAATGTVRARVDAAKFPDVRQALRGMGHVETDTVDQQKTARGGEPTSAAPVRVEQATIDLTVSTPALLITRRAQIRVETKDVEAVYLASRRTSEAAGGRVLDGGLSNRSDGGSASLTVQVDVEKFAALVEAFKASGEVKHAVVNQSAGAVAVPVRERAEINLVLQSPPAILGEEHGIARTVRETFARSWGGLLWSIEKLFVGLSLAGPWALAVVIGWLLWRRARRRKPAPAQ